jgi:plastocyanin
MEPTDNQPTQPVATHPAHTAPGKPKKQWTLVAVLAGIFLLVVGVSVYSFFALQPKDNEAAAAEVGINEDGLNAATVLVRKGSEITWTNNDELPHRIVSDDEKIDLDSGEALAKGDSYTHTFEEAGTYSYYDPTDIDGFKGIIIVQ